MTPTPKSWREEWKELVSFGGDVLDFEGDLRRNGIMEIESFISNLLSIKAQEIRGMKKQPTQHPIGCPDNNPGCAVFHCEMRLSNEDRIFNEALESAAKILEQ